MSFMFYYFSLTMDLSSKPQAGNHFLNDSTYDQDKFVNHTTSASEATHLRTPETVMVGLKIVVGFTGILGNSMVCAVLNKMRSEKVKFLIRSQAIIDLMTSVFFVVYAFGRDLYPIQIPRRPIPAFLYCLLWKWATVKFWLFSVSTFNLIAISIERYISIIHPLWYLSNFTKNKTILLGCCTWFLGPIFQIIYSVSSDLLHQRSLSLE